MLIKKTLCVILIFLGASRGLLFFAPASNFKAISSSFLDAALLSPLPVVFSESYFFTKLSLRLTLKNKEVLTLPFDAKFSQKITGTSGRSRILYLFLGRPQLFPEYLWSQVIQYYFCTEPIMKSYLDLDAEVEEVFLYFEPPVPVDIQKTEFKHICR